MSDSLWPHCCSMPGFHIHHQLLELAQTHVDAIQPSHLLSSPSPPAFNLSQHQGHFKWVSSSHQVAKVLEFQLQHVLPMNIQDWFPLGLTDWICLQSKGLKSLLQQYSSKKSILWCSAFIIVQLSHPYMTTGKTMLWLDGPLSAKSCLCFNMLSKFVIAFLPRSKRLLISWLKSPFSVISEPKKIVFHCFHCFLIYLSWSDGTRYHDLSFLNVEI